MRRNFFFFCMSLLLTHYASGQGTPSFAGSWEGTLNVGIELRIIFHVKQTGSGAYSATADSPDQSAYGLTCDTTIVDGTSITIEMKNLNARFTGTLAGDSVISGTFTQGVDLPLQLKKTGGNAKVVEKKRPQTPRPPFPYKSEDITYPAKDKSITLAGTLTIPQGKGPFPVALLITGSGPQTRDEDIFGHKIFAILADHLTRQGYMVLRVDDRGVGKSTGNFATATSVDFASDVEAGIDYLLTRKDVDTKKIGLIGHSEGGMIAPIVATQRKDISFVVLLAGPGIPVVDLMAEQNIAVLGSAGFPDSVVSSYSIVYNKMVRAAISAADNAAAHKTISTLLQEWATGEGAGAAVRMGFNNEAAREAFAGSLAKEMSSPWFKYFLSYDPTPYLEKLKTKVLALNGSNDIQVIPSSNLGGIERALKKAGNKRVEIKELPGLNHLFQACTACTLEEYDQLEESFSPVALKAISDWMEKNVK